MAGLSKSHMAALEARSIDVELASQLQWYTETDGGSEWLVIPYIQNGVTVNHKYRTLAGKKMFRQDPGGQKCFYNIDALNDKSLEHMPLIITEGELDAIALMQAGFLRTLSVPDGAPAKPIGGAEDSAKYSYVRDALHKIDPNVPVILFTDNDAPGHALRQDLATQLGPHRCKFVSMPFSEVTGREFKDANEVLHELGVSELRKLIASAKWFSREGVFSMADFPELPPTIRYDLGFGPQMDKLVGLRRGDFWVVTGVPGHGKSTFVDDMMCRASVRHGLKTCFASFEKPAKPEHRTLLRKWHIANERGHSGEQKWTREEVQRADEWIQRSFTFVSPSYDDNANFDWLVQRLATSVVQDEVDVIVIDPWNEIEHDRPRDMTLTEYVSACIKRLKQFSKRFNVTVIVVAHPAKMNPRDEVTLYSISDSAHWSNKCDVGVIVLRDKEDLATISFAKVRYSDIGTRGSVTAFLDRVAMKFVVSGDAQHSAQVGARVEEQAEERDSYSEWRT